MFSVSGKINFKDGQGNLYNEDGKEAMNWEEEVDPYNLENLTHLTQYKEQQPTELDSNYPELDSKWKRSELSCRVKILHVNIKLIQLIRRVCSCII